jgi:hypothetical protein
MVGMFDGVHASVPGAKALSARSSRQIIHLDKRAGQAPRRKTLPPRGHAPYEEAPMPAPWLLTLPRLVARCSGFIASALLLATLVPACSDLTAPPTVTGGATAPSDKPAATARVASPKAPPPPPPDTPAQPAAETGESVAASHLLVAFAGATRADPSIKRTKEEAKKLATQYLARAKKGEDFGKLAEDNSDDASAKRNKGSLGRFTRQQMVKPFSDAAFSMKPGQVSELVETQFGYHVIKRTE